MEVLPASSMQVLGSIRQRAASAKTDAVLSVDQGLLDLFLAQYWAVEMFASLTTISPSIGSHTK